MPPFACLVPAGIRPGQPRAALALCAALACAGAHAQATSSSRLPPEIDLQETRTYYDLDATRVDEMRRQLEARGPRTLGGHTTAGLTRQSLYVRYRLQPSDEGCRIEGIDIETRIEIRLPRWRPKATPAEDLLAQWPTLETILAEHEEGHRDNGVWASRELLRRLQTIDGARDCAALGEAAKAVRRTLLAELRDREDAYDRVTDHGRVQIKSAIAARARPEPERENAQERRRARAMLGGF